MREGARQGGKEGVRQHDKEEISKAMRQQGSELREGETERDSLYFKTKG